MEKVIGILIRNSFDAWLTPDLQGFQCWKGGREFY